MFNRGRMTHNFKFKTVAGTLRKEHYPIRGITKALKRKKLATRKKNTLLIWLFVLQELERRWMRSRMMGN